MTLAPLDPTKWSGLRGALLRAQAEPPVTEDQAPETEAGKLLVDLEERVRSGDESVSVEEVEQARGLARFATLRQEAAERRAKAKAEQEAQRRCTAALTEAERLLALHPQEAIDARVQDVRDAVAALRAEVDGYNECAAAAFQAMSQAVPVLDVRPGTPKPRVPGLSWAYYQGAPMLWRDGDSILRMDREHLVKRSTELPSEG